MSVSFDRAAAIYDETRGLTAEEEQAVTALLSSELAGRGRCLEVGVGTGRMALPLHGAGVPMAGVDISLPMLSRLVQKGGGLPFPLARADGTALPFSAGSFGAGLVCHVLHLIPGWQGAVEELVRVVGEGVLLVDLGGAPPGWPGEVQQAFLAAAGIERPRVGVTEAGDLDAFLGRSPRLLREVVSTTSQRPVDVIDRLEDGTWSCTWWADDDTRRRAAASTRQWAGERFGDLDQPREFQRVIRWRAYDL